jgi:hypothetical protein
MQIFQTWVFLPFAKKKTINFGALRRAIEELALGKVGASIGSGLGKGSLANIDC